MLKLESVTFTRLNRRLAKINLQSMVSCNRVCDDFFSRDDRFFSINSFSIEKKKGDTLCTISHESNLFFLFSAIRWKSVLRKTQLQIVNRSLTSWNVLTWKVLWKLKILLIWRKSEIIFNNYFIHNKMYK